MGVEYLYAGNRVQVSHMSLDLVLVWELLKGGSLDASSY